MKGLKSIITGNITGWNRNIWKSGNVELIDINDLPTPESVLEDIKGSTGMTVEDAPTVASGSGKSAPKTPAGEETTPEEGVNVATDLDLDLDDIDVDDL